VLPVLGMEARRRMVGAVHVDHDFIERGEARHRVIVDDRIRALIAILGRAGLRISEALARTESDLDPKTGSVLVRAGKGGERRMVGMDEWGWEHVARWTEHRIQLPVGPLFCILAGPTRGRGWSATAARGELRRLAVQAGVRRRLAAHH
jgi:site-specific recombinase XerD